MIKALKKKYALSDQGAKDLLKGIVYSVLANISLMDKLTQTIHANFYQGTNAAGMAGYITGRKTRDGYQGYAPAAGGATADFNTVNGYGLYLTENDYAAEFGIMSSYQICDNLRFLVEAKAFVDTTGDANVVHLAGAPTLWGDENGNVQAATLPFRLSGVDTSCDLTPQAVEKAVIRAKEEGIPHLTKEKGFILKREGSDQVAVLLPSTIPAGLDCQELTRMELDTRRQVLYYVEAFKKYLHGMENCELTVIGPAIGFRETRRMKGKEIITAQDVLGRRKRPDGVARAGWKPEIHMDANKMGTYIEVSEGSWFDVPLGALQCESLDNLYGAGRMVSSEQTAHAAVRVMGTCFATGHAAGVAAACQALRGQAEADTVREELRKQGALL